MKKTICLIVILFFMILVFTSCSNSSKTKDIIDENYELEEDGNHEEIDNDEEETLLNIDKDKEDELSASNLECPTDFKDYWETLYYINKEDISGWNDIPTYATEPIFCLLTAFEYDMLNMDNKNGRYEGNLILNGNKAYIEKNGSKFTFGYDDIRKEDGFDPSSKKDDRLYETGTFDAEKGTYYVDSYVVQKDGIKSCRTTSEYQIEDDGSISCYIIMGSLYDYRGDENPSNSFIFIRNGIKRYEYVIAKGVIGNEFEILPLEEDMSSEKAKAVFENAGYEITDMGTLEGNMIVNERFVEDLY